MHLYIVIVNNECVCVHYSCMDSSLSNSLKLRAFFTLPERFFSQLPQPAVTCNQYYHLVI